MQIKFYATFDLDSLVDSTGVRGRLPVENATQLMKITGQTQEEAEEIMADFPGGLYFATAPLDEAFPVPMSIMKEPDVVVLDGRIEWPADLECVPEIAGFQAVRSRAGLDSLGNETSSSGGDDGADDGTEDARRRMMERDEAERRRLKSLTCKDHGGKTYTGASCCEGRLKKEDPKKPYHKDLRKWKVKNAAAGIEDETWTAPFTYSENPATEECKALENEIFRLYSAVSKLTRGATSRQHHIVAESTFNTGTTIFPSCPRVPLVCRAASTGPRPSCSRASRMPRS